MSSILNTFLYNLIYMDIDFKNNKISALRKEKKLSQLKLSKELGTSQANLSRWEKGIIIPSVVECWKIANYFDVSMDYLCGRKEY